MKIGEKTLQKGGELLSNSLLTYEKAINEAFLKCEGELKISLSLSIKEGAGNGSFKLQSGIKFVTDQINDTFTDSSEELQTDLFKNQPTKLCPIRDNETKVFETVCAKCPTRKIALMVSGKKMPFILPMNSELPILAPGEMIQHRSCSAWADVDYDHFIGDQLLSCVEKEEKPKLKKVMGGKR